MKSLEESVAISMDGKQIEIVEHLPYILQDLWEIGAIPKTIIDLLEKHNLNNSELKMLDLGCGKGPVSIKLAERFGFRCLGIDAIEDFIKEAKLKAKEYKVDSLCRFEVGDIRIKLKELSEFDIIILGSIGHVLGNYEETIKTLEKYLNKNGVLVIDDGYIDDNFSHPVIQKRTEILKQIARTGFTIKDEVFISEEEITDMDNFVFGKLKQRCVELIKKFPEKSELFRNYIKAQEEENDILENNVTCSTMLISRV